MQTQIKNIEEFGSLVVCAIRHCNDRVDNVPEQVIEAVKKNWYLISRNDRVVVKKDVAYTVDNKFVAMEFDVKRWISFYDWIAEHQEDEISKEPIVEAFGLGVLTINAIRYCFGRMSYMPSLITNATKHNWSLISNEDKTVILKDLAEAFQSGRSMGDKCDRRNWVKFHNWVLDWVESEIPKQLKLNEAQ